MRLGVDCKPLAHPLMYGKPGSLGHTKKTHVGVNIPVPWIVWILYQYLTKSHCNTQKPNLTKSLAYTPRPLPCVHLMNKHTCLAPAKFEYIYIYIFVHKKRPLHYLFSARPVGFSRLW